MIPESINDNDNTEIVSNIIARYNEVKEYKSIKNVSINVETEKNVYKLIRLNDEQYYQLHKNSIAIFEDYGHMMSLYADKDIIYSSFSKMFTALKLLFGESGKYYDDWKGSFSFPFLILNKDKEEFAYLMNIYNIRSSIEFGIRKLIPVDDTLERDIIHNPFEEFSKEEINYFINFFVGYLTGFFNVISKQYNKLFFQTIRSNLILFGYDGTEFFDYQYDEEEELKEDIEELEKKIKQQQERTDKK